MPMRKSLPKALKTEKGAVINSDARLAARAHVRLPGAVDEGLGGRIDIGATRPVLHRNGGPGERAEGKNLEFLLSVPCVSVLFVGRGHVDCAEGGKRTWQSATSALTSPSSLRWRWPKAVRTFASRRQT